MPREDPRYKKKERRKEIFIVVPRRREKIFPFLYFPVRLPLLLLLVLQLQDREDQSGSRCEGISLFFNPIQSSMDGRNEGRGIFFFFSFSRRRHTVLLLVKIRRVYSYIKRILRQGTYEISIARIQSRIRKIFLLDQSPLLSSSMSSSVAERPRGWPRGAIISPRLFVSVYVSISFRTSGKPTNRVTLI